jgi:hypothetical protein
MNLIAALLGTACPTPSCPPSGVASPERRDLAAVLEGKTTLPMPGECRLVAADRYAAVVAPAAFDPTAIRKTRDLRGAVARAALARQRALEALMAAGPLLPVAPGTSAPSDVSGFLAENDGLLARGFRRVGNGVQYQVTIAWDVARAAARFGAHSPREADSLAGIARELADEAESSLEAISRDAIRLPADEAGLLNMALLVGPEQVADLEAALERIDAIWPEGLRIRLVGPGPCVSFALLKVQTHATAHVIAAARMMGLDPRDAAATRALDLARCRTEILRWSGRERQEGRDAPAPEEVDAALSLLEPALIRAGRLGIGLEEVGDVVVASLHRDGDAAMAPLAGAVS